VVHEVVWVTLVREALDRSGDLVQLQTIAAELAEHGFTVYAILVREGVQLEGCRLQMDLQMAAPCWWFRRGGPMQDPLRRLAVSLVPC
jgi:hypothetical protein